VAVIAQHHRASELSRFVRRVTPQRLVNVTGIVWVDYILRSSRRLLRAHLSEVVGNPVEDGIPEVAVQAQVLTPPLEILQQGFTHALPRELVQLFIELLVGLGTLRQDTIDIPHVLVFVSSSEGEGLDGEIRPCLLALC